MHASKFDRLCLAFGLIAASSRTLHERIPTDKQNTAYEYSSCPLTYACDQSCACTEFMSSLDVLAQLYYLGTNRTNDMVDLDVTEIVLRGHLAVSLGFLMHGSEDNMAALRQLEDDLLGSAKAFVGKLYKVVMERIGRVGVREAKGMDVAEVVRDLQGYRFAVLGCS